MSNNDAFSKKKKSSFNVCNLQYVRSMYSPFCTTEEVPLCEPDTMATLGLCTLRLCEYLEDLYSMWIIWNFPE